MLTGCINLTDRYVVAFEKFDGSNIRMSNNFLSGCNTYSYESSRELWRSIKDKIPSDCTIELVNLKYTHYVKYSCLVTCFYVNHIIKNNHYLSWIDTIQICDDLHLLTPPAIYYGKFTPFIIYDKYKKYKPCFSHVYYGMIIRDIESFHYSNPAIINYTNVDIKYSNALYCNNELERSLK